MARILTTHVGSLPRPHDLLDLMKAKLSGQGVDEAAYEERIRKAVVDIVKQQKESGIDEVILYFNVGNKPNNLVKEQMHRFMQEIAPHFEGKHLERLRLQTSQAA